MEKEGEKRKHQIQFFSSVCMCFCIHTCMCVYMCMCVRACACVFAYIHVCVYMCMRVRGCVHAQVLTISCLLGRTEIILLSSWMWCCMSIQWRARLRPSLSQGCSNTVDILEWGVKLGDNDLFRSTSLHSLFTINCGEGWREPSEGWLGLLLYS